MVYGAELMRTLSYRYAADFTLCPAPMSAVTLRTVAVSMPCDLPVADAGVTIRFAPYARISSFICCGTATHTDARQNSVAAPTSDAITAIIARERRRNTAPHSIVKNILRFVIAYPLRKPSTTHLPCSTSAGRKPRIARIDESEATSTVTASNTKTNTNTIGRMVMPEPNTT